MIQLTTIQIIGVVIGSLILLLLIFILWYNWHKIMSFIYPSKYVSADILMKDNTITPILKPKKYNSTKDRLGFSFQDTFYFYDPDFARMNGRVQQFYYREGQGMPIDLGIIKKEFNTALLEEYKNISVADLFKANELGQMILYIILGAVIGLLLGGIIGYAVKTGEVNKAAEAAKAGIILIGWRLKNE